MSTMKETLILKHLSFANVGPSLSAWHAGVGSGLLASGITSAASGYVTPTFDASIPHASAASCALRRGEFTRSRNTENEYQRCANANPLDHFLSLMATLGNESLPSIVNCTMLRRSDALQHVYR